MRDDSPRRSTGTVSRILAVASRLMAFISSIIVCGIIGRFVRHLDVIGMNYGSKIVYVLALSGLSIFFSLILMPPFRYQFWAFPLDFAFFIMWMVAFALLANLSGQCSNQWYWWVWRFSWNANRCSTWRTALAFSFIASIMWLINALLGAYRTFRDRGTSRAAKHRSLGSTAEAPMVETSRGTAPPPPPATGTAAPGVSAANPHPVATNV
jgi:hypothetical protein